jgi:putative transposase
MPVHRHKKNITSTAPGSMREQADPALPDQPSFQHHLRELARGAIRVVLEDVMSEELDALIGVGWGECSPKRKGYRNGSYTRDLVTSSGRIEEIKVPRDRAGQFHTQVFDRYSRYEPQVAQGLTKMFVAGVSTHKVGEVAQTLLGVAPSASTISRLNQTLTQQFDAWRERPLQQHWRILYLDGVHFSIRHGEKADATIILTALGIDLAGNKEVLALRACAEEDKDGWACGRGFYIGRNHFNAPFEQDSSAFLFEEIVHFARHTCLTLVSSGISLSSQSVSASGYGRQGRVPRGVDHPLS